MPRVARRGYGLGNEIIPWARAFLAARLLDANLLPPAFALNRRRYWRHFNTAHDDWIRNRAIEYLFPTLEFTENDYLEHGGGDILAALSGFAATHRLHEKSAYVLTTSGLWGGFRHIAPARDFVRATLYQSKFAARNLVLLHQRLQPQKVLVGMHIRLGDFRESGSPGDYGKGRHLSLPLEWFRSIAHALVEKFAGEVQFLVVSDGTPAQLTMLTSTVPCTTTHDLPNSDCSDVLALANSDLLVCSPSTYSALAVFLSDSPYLWFAPSLHRHPEGCYSMGNIATASASERLAIAEAVSDFTAAPSSWPARGLGCDMRGELPARFLDFVAQRRARRQWQSDLACQGVCPVQPA